VPENNKKMPLNIASIAPESGTAHENNATDPCKKLLPTTHSDGKLGFIIL
jgi:hypothetical protein